MIAVFSISFGNRKLVFTVSLCCTSLLVRVVTRTLIATRMVIAMILKKISRNSKRMSDVTLDDITTCTAMQGTIMVTVTRTNPSPTIERAARDLKCRILDTFDRFVIS